AALKFIETGNQFGNGAFARACVTDKGHALAGANVETEVLQHRFAGNIFKRDIFKLNLSGQISGGLIIILHNAVIRVDQAKDALGCAETLLELTPEGGGVDKRKPEAIHTLNKQEPHRCADGLTDHQ